MIIVFTETLRKYPIFPFVERRCTKKYVVSEADLVIEEGMACFISTLGLHYDEKYFPEPEKFIPERFTENVNKEGFVYLPFGAGPRHCIGACQICVLHFLIFC